MHTTIDIGRVFGARDVIDPELGGGAEAESGWKLYKGVAPQPNGRWGAQIYKKRRRVWLGTFGARLRCGGATVPPWRRRVTNIEPMEEEEADAAELAFLRSKAEVGRASKRPPRAPPRRRATSAS